MTRQQRTLRTPVEFAGIGLHSGEKVQARVLPAAPDSGIEFVRTDMPDSEPIPAQIGYYSETERRSQLQRGTARVETIEHFLSACSGLGIDNLTVELSGAEMPGLDGSAREYIESFKKAGVIEQRATAKQFKLTKPIYVREGNASIVALPNDQPGLILQYIAAFDEPGVEGGTLEVDLSPDTYTSEIALARTFCLESEVEQLQAAGLGKGANEENTLILGREGAVPRVPKEPIRHKLLDLIGDLALLGAELQAHVIATRSGHKMNASLVRKLLEEMEIEEAKGVVRRETEMDIREVMRMLPHRYPFLLIDRVIEIDGFRRAVAIKNVSVNEPYFQGHFPKQPIMPGVLQLEAMAQLAGVLLLRKLENTGKLAVLWAIDKVKLRGAVTPGDQLRVEVETLRMKGQTAQVRGTGSVAGKIVCEANLMFTMLDA